MDYQLTASLAELTNMVGILHNLAVYAVSAPFVIGGLFWLAAK